MHAHKHTYMHETALMSFALLRLSVNYLYTRLHAQKKHTDTHTHTHTLHIKFKRRMNSTERQTNKTSVKSEFHTLMRS